jgi:hypothetical protein
MLHSVRGIGKMNEELSILRNEKVKFDKKDFFNFAFLNMKKYSIQEEENDLFVSTWHSDALITDYKNQLKIK